MSTEVILKNLFTKNLNINIINNTLLLLKILLLVIFFDSLINTKK